MNIVSRDYARKLVRIGCATEVGCLHHDRKCWVKVERHDRAEERVIYYLGEPIDQDRVMQCS